MTLYIVVWACDVVHYRTNNSTSNRLELLSSLVGTAGRFGTAYISLFFPERDEPLLERDAQTHGGTCA